jgi:SAM-dependent methyltransferase
MQILSQIDDMLSLTNEISSSSIQHFELEVRLGKFKNNHFLPGLSKFSFDKLYNLFKWTEETIEETIFKNIQEKQRKNIGWILKDKVKQHNNPYENIRIALNLETVFTFKDILKKYKINQEYFSKNMIDLFRKKKRYTTIIEHWKLELTCVEVYKVINNEWVKQNTVYECEIELHDFTRKSLDSFQKIWNTISNIHYSSFIFPMYYNLVKSNKFIGNQPKTLEYENMHFLSNDYLVCDKADGERVFLIYTKYNGNFLLNTKIQVISRYMSSNNYGISLIDGEYINGKFLAFDCLFFNSNDCRNENLIKRLEYLQQLKLDVKKFTEIQKCKEIMNKSYDYNLDGLIFTPKYENYSGNIMKWKPQHTIDVYVDENNILMAYSSKDRKNIPLTTFFKPTNVVKTLNTLPLEKNSITELLYDIQDNIWKPIAIRHDKTRPNAILTVISIIKAITENITLDDILKFLLSPYNTPGKILTFRQDKIDIKYRKFHNYIKNYLISYPSNGRTLLDLGCGKGGDIMKWINNGYTDVLAIDFSHTHLYGPNGFAERYEKVKDKINITFVWGDVLKPLSVCGMNDIENDKLKKWINHKFDTISCQFAIHYFLNCKIEWNIFIKNIKLFLKPGGYFIGTFLNAHKLSTISNHHVFKINNIPFYTLKYNNLTYNELKQKNIINQYKAFWKIPPNKISILTSEWNSEIEENMIFPEHLDMLLVKGNMVKIKNESFETLLNNELTNDEKLLSILHNYFIYQSK